MSHLLLLFVTVAAFCLVDIVRARIDLPPMGSLPEFPKLFLGSGKSYCDNNLSESLKCCKEVLEEKYHLEKNKTDWLVKVATSLSPYGHPVGDHAHGDLILWGEKKMICHASQECSCQLTKDWCHQPYYPPKKLKESNPPCNTDPKKDCFKEGLTRHFRYFLV